VESSRLNLTLDRGTPNDLAFIEKEIHFDTNSGEISSVISNHSTIVTLTMGCFYSVFRWQCQVPHHLSTAKRDNADQITQRKNELPPPQLLPKLLRYVWCSCFSFSLRSFVVVVGSHFVVVVYYVDLLIHYRTNIDHRFYEYHSFDKILIKD